MYILHLTQLWILLIKFIVGLTIYIRWRVRIYGTPGVFNNFSYYNSFNGKVKSVNQLGWNGYIVFSRVTVEK